MDKQKIIGWTASLALNLGILKAKISVKGKPDQKRKAKPRKKKK